MKPVTTTVVVHGEVKDDYLPDAVSVGTLDGATLKDAPISATVVTRDLLNDQVARLLSDVVKDDASVGEDYAPVGYYGDFEIRGFPIDLATGLEINGLTIAGEQDVPLENKDRVEILKGIAGVESGVTSAGGLIDYVTKRPATVGALDMATDHRGSAYGAVDLGRLFGSRKQVGARLNLAGEKIESYVNDANGWRAMGSGAADWKLSPKAILNGNFEYQHKVERSVCGYQLLGGTTVPDLHKVFPSTMLGEQSWEKPNTFDTYNAGARFDYNLPHNWLVFAQAGLSHSLIDDNVIYAYGTSFDANGNVNCPNAPDAPAYFFCPDGTYGIYDYRDPGELRKDEQAESIISGHIKAGAVSEDVALVASCSCAACSNPVSICFRIHQPLQLPTARCTTMSALKTSTIPSRRFPSARPIPLNIRFNPPARADFGKTAISLPVSCRTEFIFPAIFNCLPVGVSIRCVTTTIRCVQPLLRIAHPPSRTNCCGCRSTQLPSTPSRTLRSIATMACCFRWVRKGRGGWMTRTSFLLLSSRARPR